ncbi:MAG: hypothetical protein ABR568_08745 [Pyrinomonadaceae bacterium]
MAHQIDFGKAGLLLVSVGESANRYLLFEQRAWLGAGATAQLVFTPF